MLDALSATCDRCGDPLSNDGFAIEFATGAGVRRAYECDCGAVTVTVVDRDR